MIRIIAIAALMMSLFSTAVRANEVASPDVGIDEATVRLIAGHVPGHGDMLGLQFTMDPKWKVYWRSPGDAGFPPTPNWQGSRGASGFGLHWPLPERFMFYGLETYGYGTQVTLPVSFERETSEAHVQLELFYAACAEICVPVTVDLAIDLPEGTLPVSDALVRALADVPENAPDDVLVAVGYKQKQLHARFMGEHLPGQPDLIVEGSAELLFGRAECAAQSNAVHCDIPLLDMPDDFAMVGQPLVFTLFGQNRALETRAIVREAR